MCATASHYEVAADACTDLCAVDSPSAAPFALNQQGFEDT